jgi:sterol 14-demethylase
MPRGRTPPSPPGWPLIGHFLQYRRDHLEVFWRAYRTLGPIFSLRFGPQRLAVAIGPDHQRFFFSQADHILSLPEVYRFVIPVFGEVLNAANDEATRRAHLSLLRSAFHGSRMERHVTLMAEETSAWLATLGDEGRFEVHQSFSALAMNIAAGALMGPEIRAAMTEFAPLFHDLARGMDFVLPPNLPLPRFRRRDQARERLRQLIGPVIAKRRSQTCEHGDFLQAIVTRHCPDGETGGADDDMTIGLALLTAFTAYIATAAQVSWSLIQLLQNPHYLRAVDAERKQVLGEHPEEAISPDSLGRLVLLERALKETQRMHPVMTHYARFNAQTYELGGYEIPRGWLTVVCPAIAHRLPDIFANPDVYDPDRFSEDRREDRRHPYSLIGFGAGLYRCPGEFFGINEMKCVISLLMHHFDLRLATDDPLADFEMGIVRPRPPCLIAFRRRRGARDSVGFIAAGENFERQAPALAVRRATQPV